jgi:LysR family transcriptional regulator, transcriptional activator for bauABCD operon
MGKLDLLAEPSVIFAKNVDWNLFKVFFEIARRRGIGAAARALNKKQPSITAALRRLEDQIGARLCIRTPRGIELTVQGHQLLALCRGIHAAVQNMPRAVSATRADVSGTVTLRVISNLYILDTLSNIFDDFHTRYPAIELKLDVAPWREVLNSLKKGDVELAIGFEDEPNDDYLYIHLTQQKQQIYCGQKHRFFGKPPVPPSLMEDEPFVITRDEPIVYTRYCERYGLGRRIGGFADSLNERMWLIQLGMGIGFLPKPIVDSSSFAAGLWPLLPDAEAPVCGLYLMASAHAVRSAPAQLLLDTALAHLQVVPSSWTASGIGLHH